jgi:hypothetical protein
MELTSASSATNKLCSIASKSAPEVSAKLGTMFAAILLVCLATLNPLDFFFSGPFSTKVVADKRQKKPQQEQPKKKTPTQEEKQTLATNFFFIFYHQTLQQIRWEVKERKGKPTEALFHNGCRKL